MQASSFRFGPYRIDTAARELRREGELVPLSPVLFDCITWLLTHRSRAVGRDELIAAAWGKTDIADTQLAQAILKARRALGDSGDEQRVIRTIPKFGYRWVAEVEIDEPVVATSAAGDDASVAVASPVAAEPARRAPARWRIAGIASLAALLVVATWILYRPRADAPPVTQAAIAVLPVTVAAGSEWSWLRLGMMDLVGTRLHEAGMRVVPGDNVVALLRSEGIGTDDAERAVRSALAPRWLVVPTLRRSDTGWTATLELRAAGSRRQVVEVVAIEPLAAIGEATRRLLPLVGATTGSETFRADGDRVARVRAAFLANDYAQAQREIDAAQPDERALPEMRLLQAQVDFGAGRYEGAEHGFDRLFADLGDRASTVLRARVLNGRGAAAVRLLDLPASERDYDAALALLHGDEEPALQGQVRTGRGVVHAIRGEYAAAMDDFARARILLQVAGDALALARVQMNEAALNGEQGHPARALADFEAAANGFERFAAIGELAGALANQVEARLALLQPAEALAVSERARALLPRLEDPAIRRRVSYWHACALAANGRTREARGLLEALLADAGAGSELKAMAGVRAAALAFADDDFERARSLAMPVADTDGPWANTRAEAWIIGVRALRAQGRPEAAATLRAFRAWAARRGEPSIAVLAGVAGAEQAWFEARHADANAQYAEALAQADRGDVPRDIATVALSWGTARIGAGDIEGAGAIVGRVARWSGTEFSCALLFARMHREQGHAVAWRAALERARALSGERAIPQAVSLAPDAPLAIGADAPDAPTAG